MELLSDIPAPVAKVLSDQRVMGFWACWGPFLAATLLVVLFFVGIEGPALLLKLAPLAVPLFRMKTVLDWNPSHRWARAVQSIVRVGFIVAIGAEVIGTVVLNRISNNEHAQGAGLALGLVSMAIHFAVARWGVKKLKLLDAQP